MLYVKKIKEQKGVAALITVIIISVAGLLMAYSAAFLGLGSLDMSYTSLKGAEAFAVADGCMEESLRRIKIDNNYEGGVFLIGEGKCEVSITGSGPNFVIEVLGSIDDFYSSLKAELSITGKKITLDSWEEL